MQRNILSLIAGLIIGMILMGVLIWNTMPKMMITVHESKLDFESTVQSIQDAALNNGWKVPKIYNIQKSLEGFGVPDRPFFFRKPHRIRPPGKRLQMRIKRSREGIVTEEPRSRRLV